VYDYEIIWIMRKKRKGLTMMKRALRVYLD